MRYFAGCTTLEELKATYKKLAMKHHPDLGGDVEIMKEINAEYDRVFPNLKNKHRKADGQTFEKENNEAPDEFKDLIEKLIRMNGIEIEVIGCFIWVSGNTKEHKDQLKALGFKWHSKKVCWYLAPKDYHKKNKQQYDMEEIRDMFGVQYSGTGRGYMQLAGA